MFKFKPPGDIGL